MIPARIKIGDGAIEDTFSAHKLIYISSDHRTEAPIKKRDTTSYAEEAGEHTDPRTVRDAFDYKATFIIDGQNRNLKNVNAIISAFNEKLYTQSAGNGIRTYKEVILYNDFKRVKIVGLPEPIAEPKEMKRSKNGFDFAEVELTIHVSDPTKCNFNLKSDTGNKFAIKLHTNGDKLYLIADKPIDKKVYDIGFLTRGASMSRINYEADGEYGENHQKGFYRWHVDIEGGGTHSEIEIGPDGLIEYYSNYDDERSFYDYFSCVVSTTSENNMDVVRVRKAGNSNLIIPHIVGKRCTVTYGIAIYEKVPNKKRPVRVSNVAYFQSNMVVVGSPDDENKGIRQWLST